MRSPRRGLTGEKRALVVMATGLGKTLLAAYDADAFRATLDHRIRILFFIAHRRDMRYWWVSQKQTHRHEIGGGLPLVSQAQG